MSTKPVVLGIALLVAGVLAVTASRRHARGPSSPPSTSGLTSSPAEAFVDGSDPSERGRTVFTLTNHADRPVTILAVVPGCALCARVTDLTGQVIGPGGSCELGVEVDLPVSGLSRQEVSVFHDGDHSPLRVGVEVLGRQKPPYLISSFPKRVTFFDLSSPGTAIKLRVTTCELGGSLPWLGSVDCDLPEVTIGCEGVSESRAGSVVKRTYDYRVSWRRLPMTPEFNGVLWGARNDGKLIPVEVGEITGTLARPSRSAVSLAR